MLTFPLEDEKHRVPCCMLHVLLPDDNGTHFLVCALSMQDSVPWTWWSGCSDHISSIPSCMMTLSLQDGSRSNLQNAEHIK